MAALEKIILWAQKELPAWQADAVRRLLLCESLSAEDKDTLYLMMKVHGGLTKTTPESPKAVPPNIEGLSGSAKPDDNICLKSINCIANVNAIPDSTELLIGHKGVTVIYGENGSGKSGFARVLKRACNARDKKDEVLGDIFGKNFSKKPRVRFKLDINEKVDCFHEWEEGHQPTSALSKITVFDSKCSRVIIDDRNEYQYKPYGTHVFEDLAKLCDELKLRIVSETPPAIKPTIQLLIPGTIANNFYLTISSKTTDKELTIYDNWSDTEEAQLVTVKEWLDAYKKQDIDSKIKSLKSIISKYVNLIRATRKIAKDFSPQQISMIDNIIEEFNAAAEAHRITEEAVSSGDFPLKGVKSEAWRQLFESAEKYSKQYAYPDIEYPNPDTNTLCVLCMQSLTEPAKKRMRSFKNFMLDEAGNRLKIAKSNLQNLSKTFDSYHLRDLKELTLYTAELQNINSLLSDDLQKVYEYFFEILKNIRDAISSKSSVKTAEQPHIAVAPIISWLKEIKKQVQDYETSKTPGEVIKRQKDYDELISKNSICQNLAAIKEYINACKLSEKYQSCINLLDTTKISKKGRTLIAEECTPELQKRLQEELSRLGARSFDIKFKPRGERGVTVHEFEFEGALAKHPPSKILSEGEQKAVGIAGFFAELSLSSHNCPIVFDDPVTSLDHIYREKIAERIAAESLKRQIIVFTHDIVFLHGLEKHLGQISGNMNVITLKRLGASPGNVFSSKPWHAMKVKDRLTYLEQLIPSFSPLYESDLSAYNDNTANWYDLFRETWEAIVEEILLAGAVQRFDTDVKTQNLKKIEITDEDYRTVDLYMSKASEWMYGHNKSKVQSVNRPAPSEIEKDIGDTRTFLGQIKSRHKINEERRKEMLKPQPALMG